MNIRNVDLNFLVVFDTLMRACHVSNAAKQIGLSQSAMSHTAIRWAGIRH